MTKKNLKFIGPAKEYIELIDISKSSELTSNPSDPSTLSLFWSIEDDTLIQVDGINYPLKKNEVLFLTDLHQVQLKQLKQLKLLRFNRAFYCIIDHDHEVGCRGLLFFGSKEIPIVQLQGKDLTEIELVWKVLETEIEKTDDFQLDMLQMILKRILILSTRVYKQNQNLDELDENNYELIREFNFLVEQNYREKHSVAEYAALLFKSPKTLSNTFKRLGKHTPQSYIQDRIMLEAKRRLHYTDLQISEIADYLGFSDIHSFSRFFKKHSGLSPLEFRKESLSGNIAK